MIKPQMPPPTTTALGAVTFVTVIAQVLGLAVLASLLHSLPTTTNAVSALANRVEPLGSWFFQSQYGDALLRTISVHAAIYALAVVFAYISSLAFLIRRADSLDWSHECMSAALWSNVLKSSNNYLAFPFCSSSCIGRKATNLQRGLESLLANQYEASLAKGTMVLYVVMVFIFVFLIKISAVKLALVTLLAIHGFLHSTFELVSISVLAKRRMSLEKVSANR